MSLPVPNLDDRSFQQLVDEAKRHIPRHLPEWTNHNVADPGVALIELFAWMTEVALFRLNQVPDAFYTHMLNLIGFQRFPSTAAHAGVTFWLVDVVDAPVVVQKGTEVSTSIDVGTPAVFRTVEDLTIAQPILIGSLTSSGADDDPGGPTYVDVWDELRVELDTVICFPNDPMEPGDCFLLGFETSLAGSAIQLTIEAGLEGIGVLPAEPPLQWEVMYGADWLPVDVRLDTTGGLNRHGRLVLLIPGGHEPATLGGVRAYWLRARLLGEATGRPIYRASPRLRTVSVAALGGTVEAEHSERVPREVIGRSNGRPDQRFVVSRPPVLARKDGETVEVVDPDGTVKVWTAVDDFIDTEPDDRHFTWSSTSGEVRFGPVVRDAQGTLRSYGAIPLEGAQIVVTEYRTGGGAAGNVGARTITNLRSTVPYVAAVENFRAATGGVDAETVDNAKIRGPYLLRAGARAVTVPDFERLTREADPAIARVRCLPPTEAGKPIRILLVPDVDTPAELLQLDDFALPDGMIARVVEHLEERRMLGSVIEVLTPYYQGVTIAALVAAGPGRPQRLVKERATEALYRFIHPLWGGPDGSGWPFDTDLNAAAIFQLLEGVDGVERVDGVLFFEYDLRNNERSGFGQDVVKLGSNALFLAANHQVVVSA